MRGWKTRAICALRCGTRIQFGFDRIGAPLAAEAFALTRANTQKERESEARRRDGGRTGFLFVWGPLLAIDTDPLQTTGALSAHCCRTGADKRTVGCTRRHVPCMLEDVTLVLHAAQSAPPLRNHRGSRALAKRSRPSQYVRLREPACDHCGGILTSKIWRGCVGVTFCREGRVNRSIAGDPTYRESTPPRDGGVRTSS